MINLGKLQKVDIREIWKHEAGDFTPWLAKPDNLETLGDVLGIEFDTEDIQTEVGVGDFSADILTSDASGRKIVIENQLERTDHDHLGKCITYAAGVGAKVIIWIAREVRDEHRQAIEWLNLNSSDEINLFLVQLEALRIENSVAAPHFAVIESPNDWTKTIRSHSSSKTVSETKLKQQHFFESLRDFGQEHSKHIKKWSKPQQQHWYSIFFNTKAAHLDVYANTNEQCIKLGLYIDGGKDSEQQNKDLYDKIYSDKDKIEEKLGELIWDNGSEKRSKLILCKIDVNPLDEEAVQNALPSIIDKLDQLMEVFPKYIRKK